MSLVDQVSGWLDSLLSRPASPLLWPVHDHGLEYWRGTDAVCLGVYKSSAVLLASDSMAAGVVLVSHKSQRAQAALLRAAHSLQPFFKFSQL